MQSGSMSWVCRSPLEIRFGTTPKQSISVLERCQRQNSSASAAGRVCTNRLDAARGNCPAMNHAEALSYMERDMAEGVAEMVFADTSIFSGGYPELTERLAKLLDQPEFLADLNERLLGLAEAYAEDKSVMRMQFYRPDKVSERFQKFALPYQLSGKRGLSVEYAESLYHGR